MKKKALIPSAHFISMLLIIFVCSQKTTAQDPLVFGVHAAFHYNPYVFTNHSYPYYEKGRPNMSFGVSIVKHVSDQHGIAMQLNFTTYNFTQVIDFTEYRAIDPNDPLMLDGETKQHVKQGYLEIPVIYQYHFAKNEHRFWYASGGLVNAFQLYTNAEEDQDLVWELGHLKYKTYFASLKLGIGYQMIREYIAIGIEPELRFFPMKIHTDESRKNPVLIGLNLNFFWLGK